MSTSHRGFWAIVCITTTNLALAEPPGPVAGERLLAQLTAGQPAPKEAAATVVSEEKKRSYEVLKQSYAAHFRQMTRGEQELKQRILFNCTIRNNVLIEIFDDARLNSLNYLEKFDVRREKPEATGYDHFRGVYASSTFEGVRYGQAMLRALPQIRSPGARAGFIKGLDQIHGIAIDILQLNWEITQSIHQRMWADLSSDDRELVQRHQPDFAYHASGEGERELAEITKQIGESPANAKAVLSRAKLFFGRLQYRAALADLARVIELDQGQRAEALYLRGSHYAEFSQLFDARTDFKALVQLDSPATPLIDMRRVRAYLAANQ